MQCHRPMTFRKKNGAPPSLAYARIGVSAIVQHENMKLVPQMKFSQSFPVSTSDQKLSGSTNMFLCFLSFLNFSVLFSQENVKKPFLGGTCWPSSEAQHSLSGDRNLDGLHIASIHQYHPYQSFQVSKSQVTKLKKQLLQNSKRFKSRTGLFSCLFLLSVLRRWLEDVRSKVIGWTLLHSVSSIHLFFENCFSISKYFLHYLLHVQI